MTETDPILELRNVTKTYSGVAAVDGVSITLYPGEVHAVLGENGAGKSTLTKMMAGVVTPSAGQMYYAGGAVSPSTPREAQDIGIAMVFQETSLVPSMTVGQNLFLGRESFFNRTRGVTIAAQQFLQSLGFDVNPMATVAMLGAAQKQMVEIARAVLLKSKVIIFDEPTATLTPEEKRNFYDLIDQLKARSVSVVFITHAIEEALVKADKITVLRDACHVLTAPATDLNRETLIRAMVGRDLSQSLYGQRKSTPRRPCERVLSVQDLRMGSAVKGSTFSVFSGQVTGFFGLVGAGRTETFKIVAGLLKRDVFHGGEIYLKGEPTRFRVPGPAVQKSIAYITEDRKAEGFFDSMSIGRNIYLGKLARFASMFSLTSKSCQSETGTAWIEKLQVKAIGAEAQVIELSGGNQQKVVIAKSLVQEPELIIFDEPTRGVDVGAIAEIHALMDRLANEGKAVVMISSYLPEVLMMSDRILVCRQGRVVEEFIGPDATEENIMYAAVH